MLSSVRYQAKCLGTSPFMVNLRAVSQHLDPYPNKTSPRQERLLHLIPSFWDLNPDFLSCQSQ